MSTYSYSPEDERTRVLRMVEEGKLSAMEAISLLENLAADRRGEARQAAAPQEPLFAGQPDPEAVPQGEAANGSPRWFHIRVTDLNSGRSKVSVNVPFRLATWGMRVGARFAPEVNGVNLEELSEMLKADGGQGKLIDVVDEEDGEHVEIFVD